jgi:hypothetical protein
MANEFVARKGIKVLSSGVNITGSSQFSADVTASGNINASAFYGNGANVTGVISSSYALTSSLATNSIVTASITGNTITFTKGNGATFPIIVVSSSTADSASYVKFENIGNKPTLISSSLQFNTLTTPFTGSFTGSFTGDGSGLTGIATTLNTAGTTGTGTVNLKTQTLTIAGGNGVTANASGQTITVSIPNGTVSSSGQVDVRNTTGITTIATTGSNTFTGIQTISNTTNSTAFNNGALIVQGGVGIAKNVNISGSLTITGLLTAISSSIQYVTSSQLIVTDNKIIVNTTDATRFGGLSIIDSGSTAATASIYWDSLNHHFIYENISGAPYNSAIIIAGPKNTGTLGNEQELTVGRIPVTTGGDHIDSRLASSSIRVDFPSRLTHVEAGLVVTGSISSSVGFSGDGSNLTGIVTTLQVTGSDGTQTTGTVNLKTQGLIVSAGEGINVSVSGQTVTVSGEDASPSNKGIATFNSTNFTVTSGDVTSNNITINGTGVTLGGTRNITLAQITTQGASTTDRTTFSNSAVITNTLYSGSTTTGIGGPTSNQVLITVPVASYDAAHFDYVIKDATNYRTGTVMAVWDGTNVEYTDTSTNDIGNTSDESFVVDISGGNARLKFTAGAGTWTVKVSARTF